MLAGQEARLKRPAEQVGENRSLRELGTNIGAMIPGSSSQQRLRRVTGSHGPRTRFSAATANDERRSPRRSRAQRLVARLAAGRLRNFRVLLDSFDLVEQALGQPIHLPRMTSLA